MRRRSGRSQGGLVGVFMRSGEFEAGAEGWKRAPLRCAEALGTINRPLRSILSDSFVYRIIAPHPISDEFRSIKTDESALCRLIFRIYICAFGARNKFGFVMLRNHITVNDDLFHINA